MSMIVSCEAARPAVAATGTLCVGAFHPLTSTTGAVGALTRRNARSRSAIRRAKRDVVVAPQDRQHELAARGSLDRYVLEQRHGFGGWGYRQRDRGDVLGSLVPHRCPNLARRGRQGLQWGQVRVSRHRREVPVRMFPVELVGLGGEPIDVAADRFAAWRKRARAR